MTGRFDTVIFDLDGTLVHSALDICASVNHVLKDYAVPELGSRQVEGMIGDGLAKTLERGFDASGITVSPDEFDVAYSRMLTYYEAHPTVRSRPYAGTTETLGAMVGAGLKLGVCTNKAEPLALSVLKNLEMTAFFLTIVGGRPGVPGKPAPDMLIEAISAVGGKPGSAVLVGDSPADAGAAAALGIPAILVSFGYSRQPVEELECAAIIDSMDALPGALSRIEGRERPGMAV